jgi:hypothetical protein
MSFAQPWISGPPPVLPNAGIRRPTLELNRALRHKEWLPEDSGLPVLAALRQEHLRLLDVVKMTSEAVWQVRQKFEAEDAARQVVLRDSFQTLGTERAPLELPEATPPEIRDEELAAAREQWEAAKDVLETFLGQALTVINDRADDWLLSLDERAKEQDVKRQEARAALALADAQSAETNRLRAWIERSSGRAAIHDHYPYGWMTPPPDDDDDAPVSGAPGIELVGPAPDDWEDE